MDKSLGRQLQWHTIVVTSCLSVPYRFLHNFVTFVIVFFCSTYYRLFHQATELTHILDGRLKELAEDAMWENALKDVAEATSKEKTKAAAIAEKKAVVSEKARVAAEKGSLELEAKLGETELKLAKAASLNMTQAKELADWKAALEACENKWYNEGFADAENSTEPVINEARKLAFEEGWLAALQALGVPKDSPLRNPNQIPFPSPSTSAHNPLDAIDKEETTSMRELVEAIDSHVELINLEATSNPHAGDQPDGNVQPPFVVQ